MLSEYQEGGFLCEPVAAGSADIRQIHQVLEQEWLMTSRSKDSQHDVRASCRQAGL